MERALPSLFMKETEIARLLGQKLDEWRAKSLILERDGLPKIDPLMGGRYWPAVEDFFHRRYGLHSMAGAGPRRPDGEENWNG